MLKLKIVIIGPPASGKTEFLTSIIETNVVGRSEVRPISESAGARHSTIMDFGRLTVDDDVMLYLFAAPGQYRFEFMWEILEQEIIGFVVMVDSTKPQNFREVKSILERFRAHPSIPCVVAANLQDRPDAWTSDDLRAAFRLDDKIKLIPCVARDKESAITVLIELIYWMIYELDT